MLRDYGIHCVGLLGAVDPVTVQRLLGRCTGRQAAGCARGIDSRPMIPRAFPDTASVHRSFHRNTLDDADVRAAALEQVVPLGVLLRQRVQAAAC